MAALLTCPCICSRLAAKDTGAENQSIRFLPAAFSLAYEKVTGTWPQTRHLQMFRRSTL